MHVFQVILQSWFSRECLSRKRCCTTSCQLAPPSWVSSWALCWESCRVLLTSSPLLEASSSMSPSLISYAFSIYTIYLMVLFRDFVSEVCQKSPYQLPTSFEPLPDFSIICDEWLVPLPVVWNPQLLKQTLVKSLRQVGICLAKETVVIISKRSQKPTHSLSLGAELVIIGQASYLWV